VNAGEQLIAQGRAEGRAEGLAAGLIEGLRSAIGRVLVARSMTVNELGSARLASCSDVATLTVWLERAATAKSEVEASRSRPERLSASSHAATSSKFSRLIPSGW
jgi:hypothetical protein